MLKKFLTTIIVLAATATAWADGYSYTLDKDNTRATISADADSENTIDDVITAIKGLSPKVQYVILPDGMTKEQVNAIGASFDATVSKNEATQTETKWVYTWNEKEVVFEGTPTTIDGKPTATVKVLVPLKEKNSSYQLYGSPYEGTVFFDAEGKCYGVSNETSDTFSLTSYKGYTYNSGTTEYTGKVAESEDMYYGVINPTSEVALRLNQPVSWTYNLNYDNSITYAHFGEVYNNGTYIFYQGGTEYPLTTETRYTYDDNGSKKLYPEDGLTRTADNKTFGWVGGTQVNLTQKDALFNGTTLYTGPVREDNGVVIGGNFYNGPFELIETTGYTYNNNNNNTLYTGPVRTTVVDGKTQYYGNTGKMFSLTTIKTASWTYKDSNWPYPTCIYEGEYISETNGETNGNIGGTFYKLTNVQATEENPVYTFTINDADHGWNQITYCSKEVKVVTDQSGNVTGYTLNDGTVLSNVTKNISGDFKYYNKPDDAMNYVYNGTVYTKLDGTDVNVQYACEGGTSVAITKAAENVKYYTDTDNKKVVYTGNVYTDNDDKEYGVKDTNSYEVALTYGIVYLKKSDNTLYTGTVYHKQGDNTAYMGGGCNEFTATSAIAWFYTSDGKETQYTAGIYNDGENTVGFIGGEEKELTHGEVKYYTKGEQTIIATDNTRISLDGDTYCDGSNAIGLTNKEGFTANLYKDGDRYVIYTGKVYGDATGYIGGTETKLTHGDIYKKEDGTIYTGYRNADNTMGCNNAQPLTISFTYEYVNPNTGETATLKSEDHLTTYEVDYTVTVKQKEIEVPTGKIHIIAYVSIPGSLYFAIGDKWYGGNDLTALTLSGSLNYADIGNSSEPLEMNKYGHAKYDTYSYDPETNQTTMSTITPSDDIQEGAVENKNCAFTNVTNLQYIDFSDAKFNVNTDMQIARGMTYNVEKVKTVYLPKDDSFTIIPAGCLINAKGITEICIPKNIKIIEGKAFHNTALSHIYTTSDNEDVIVDNGPKTITLPAGLEEIRSAGNGDGSTFTGSGMNIITDVYVLSEKAPKCAPYSFQGSMTFGNKGFKGNWAHPIGRHIYVNDNQMITVLHFPSSCTTEETKKYTDITRNYTLADETGAVDGKGKTIIWPRHAQFGRAFNQATMGYIWYDWKEYAEGATEVIETFDASIESANPTKYDQAYQGWHEFVLTGTSTSQTIQVQEETEFIQRDWYTLCVPYNLRKSHLLELFGIDPDKSANNKVKMLKETESKDVTETMYPDIRVITEISRSVSNGKMAIHLSKPLINDTENTNWEVVIPENGQGYEYNKLDGDDPIIIKGGHPFLVRGYVPAAWNDQIKNMGMYIMAIAASVNSAAVLEGKEEPYKYNDECLVNGVALPCVKHHIHARNFDYSENDANNKNKFVFKDAAHSDAACYHFIGTYTETKIPQYAYYIGKAKDGSHKFSRTTKTSFKWAPYSAVIVGLNKPNYNDNDFAGGKTSIHNIIVGLETPTNDLVILEGEDPARAGQALSIKFDEDAFSGEATGITDINIDSNVSVGNNKVYSINGQYMGTSLNNLPKGIYIINGQKKVVK